MKPMKFRVSRIKKLELSLSMNQLKVSRMWIDYLLDYSLQNLAMAPGNMTNYNAFTNNKASANHHSLSIVGSGATASNFNASNDKDLKRKQY